VSGDGCHVVRGGGTFGGRQGLEYASGISAETVGAEGICMHLGTVPPGAAAEPHLHEGHETAIYVLSGRGGMDYGANLEHRAYCEAGDFVYIGRGVPHRPFNDGDEPVRFVLARTDPNEQESVVLLPELG
jgi:uncharacterized RmlC-like cupin family protein